jgi:hypothetical protein
MQDRRSEVKNEVEAGGITSPYILPGQQGRLVEDGGAKTARRGLLAAVAYGTGCRRGGRTLTRMGEVQEQGKGAGRREGQGSDIVLTYSTCTPRTHASPGRQNDRRRGGDMSRYLAANIRLGRNRETFPGRKCRRSGPQKTAKRTGGTAAVRTRGRLWLN